MGTAVGELIVSYIETIRDLELELATTSIFNFKKQRECKQLIRAFERAIKKLDADT